MKQILKYFLKVRKDLLTLLAIAFSTYFIIEFWLNNYSEIFKGASKIGQLFSNLSISYISAFIFYFIVVHIKNEKDKENINEYIGIKVRDILNTSHLFIQPFLQIDNRKASFKDLDIKKLRSLLDSINRYSKDAPYTLNGENATWLQWWEYLKTSTFTSFSEIFIRYNHVDTELIKILTRMENSTFFTQWNMLYGGMGGFDKSFGLYCEQVKMYLEHVNDLQNYADKNLREYQNRTSNFMGHKQKDYS